jgi:thiopurine S-methyltransferase
MDPTFWEQRWETNQIGFHEGKPNRFLVKHLERLAAGRVLVPLAGKTVDLDLLIESGREVTAVELVERAVHDYFLERGALPEAERAARSERYVRGALSFVRGDVLEHLAAPYDAVFDRAATIALPPALRDRYAAHLATLVRPHGVVLLVTLEHDVTSDGAPAGPPFSVDRDEVERLYEAAFTIQELESEDVLAESKNLAAKGATRARERTYTLHRKS